LVASIRIELETRRSPTIASESQICPGSGTGAKPEAPFCCSEAFKVSNNVPGYHSCQKEYQQITFYLESMVQDKGGIHRL
jgi:hypothetical protein